MGNSNSVETKEKKWKVCKIESAEDEGDWFRIKLDDYVEFSDGKGAIIDFDMSRNLVGLRPLVPRWFRNIGGYVAINQNVTKKYGFLHNFSIEMDTDRVIRRISEEYARENPSLIEGLGQAAKETLDFFGEMVETRERYQAAVEYGNWAKQIPGWTSWDISPPPPK